MTYLEKLDPLPKIHNDILAIKKQLIGHCVDIGFRPGPSDFQDLVVLRSELKDTENISAKLFEYWLARKSI